MTQAGQIHMFIIRWKSETTYGQVNRALHDVRAFQGVVPGLLETNVGINASDKSAGYAFAAVLKFTDAIALRDYLVHPAHIAFLEWVSPLIDSAIDADFKP